MTTTDAMEMKKSDQRLGKDGALSSPGLCLKGEAKSRATRALGVCGQKQQRERERERERESGEKRVSKRREAFLLCLDVFLC
jgi:hypothetical protein